MSRPDYFADPPVVRRRTPYWHAGYYGLPLRESTVSPPLSRLPGKEADEPSQPEFAIDSVDFAFGSQSGEELP